MYASEGIRLGFRAVKVSHTDGGDSKTAVIPPAVTAIFVVRASPPPESGRHLRAESCGAVCNTKSVTKITAERHGLEADVV